MDSAVYTRMDLLEAEHWWFKARRGIIRATISRLLPVPGNAKILEAGCGTGGNLEMLSEFGTVDAFEYDENAREISNLKSGLSVPFGALPDKIPFESEKYDLIGLFDVLEHIEDDCEAIRALGDHLAVDGALLVTVPAFQWLWSKHDVTHHHFRRYTKSSLRSVAKEAGLEVTECGYFNSFLLPLAVAMRILKRLLRSNAPDDAMPSAGVNNLLYRIFSSERHIIGKIPMLAGLSVYAVIRKPEEPVA